MNAIILRTSDHCVTPCRTLPAGGIIYENVCVKIWLAIECEPLTNKENALTRKTHGS